jgi:hypothetical protein
MKAIKNREYVLLFVLSLVVFYTVLSLLGPFVPFFSSSSSITGGVLSTSTGCSGTVKLSFFPDVVDTNTRVSAILSGVDNCYGKVVFVREQIGTDMVLKCSCVIATGNGCGCAFPVGNYPCSNPNFYAQVDLNSNGDYNDQGETAVVTMPMPISGCGII